MPGKSETVKDEDDSRKRRCPNRNSRAITYPEMRECVVTEAEKASWAEVYDGGSLEAERVGFHRLVQTMLDIQERNRRASGAPHALRTLHSKMVVGVTNAELHVDAGLPDQFHVAYFEPGAVLRGSVRFSNASGIPKADGAPDMRGIAIKLALPDGGVHDLLMTSYPVSHARNANQFVEFANIASGDQATFKERLISHFGADEAMRMITTVMKGMRSSPGLQAEGFWSRGALLWGSTPARLMLRPSMSGNADQSVSSPVAADTLREGFASLLREQTVSYRLAIQSFVDQDLTPIEDASVEWLESVAPPIEVATLVIPSQDILGEEGQREMAKVDEMAFNPWNAPPSFRPLGNINRARGVVYGASAKAWAASPHG